MSLTKTEQLALHLYGRQRRKEDKCGEVLRSTPKCGENGNCDFDGCCLNCFLKGELHRPKGREGTIKCSEELHDYYYYSDDYELEGLSVGDVERAVLMLRKMREGASPAEIVKDFLFARKSYIVKDFLANRKEERFAS